MSCRCRPSCIPWGFAGYALILLLRNLVHSKIKWTGNLNCDCLLVRSGTIVFLGGAHSELAGWNQAELHADGVCVLSGNVQRASCLFLPQSRIASWHCIPIVASGLCRCFSLWRSPLVARGIAGSSCVSDKKVGSHICCSWSESELARRVVLQYVLLPHITESSKKKGALLPAGDKLDRRFVVNVYSSLGV